MNTYTIELKKAKNKISPENLPNGTKHSGSTPSQTKKKR